MDALRTAVLDGRLAAGCRLPATRVLAAELRISRGVVVEAYQRLYDEGLVTARTGVGTVVTSPPPPHGRLARLPARPASDPRDVTGRPDAEGAPGAATRAAGSGAQGTGPDTRAAGSGERGTGSGAGALRLPLARSAGQAPIAFDLSPGVPDLSAFPRAAWLRAERAVLDRATGADLGYGDPRGNAELRGELVRWLARTRGVRADPDGVIIIAGVAQGLALLAQVLRGSGATTVAMEDPGSRGARDEIAHWGLRPVPIPVDEQGLVVAELAASRARAVLLTPAHQFPTGVVLSPRRRIELLDWVAAGGLVIEDDYDAEYRYDRAPVAAVQASAPDGVAYLGSTSKTLAPGMRLGWLIPPPHLYAELVAAKHASDLGNPTLPQLIVAHLLSTGEYERHLRRVRSRQRERRDALLTAVRAYLPNCRIEGVAAGLHLLVTLPSNGEPGPGADGEPRPRPDADLDPRPDADLESRSDGVIDDIELADRIGSAGVLVHPLSWHRQRPGPPGLVLGYAAHPPDRLHEAARRLAQAIRETTRARDASP